MYIYNFFIKKIQKKKKNLELEVITKSKNYLLPITGVEYWPCLWCSKKSPQPDMCTLPAFPSFLPSCKGFTVPSGGVAAIWVVCLFVCLLTCCFCVVVCCCSVTYECFAGSLGDLHTLEVFCLICEDVCLWLHAPTFKCLFHNGNHP